MEEFIEKAEYWFRNIGPFVYPEDENTWGSFKDFIKFAKKPYEGYKED